MGYNFTSACLTKDAHFMYSVNIEQLVLMSSAVRVIVCAPVLVWVDPGLLVSRF